MVTFVGTQDKLVDALKELIELDHAAVEAYETAIARLDSQEFKNKLTEFKQDHERHIEETTNLLTDKDEEAPESFDRTKEMMVKGKVVLGDLVGDDYTILKAMRDNEGDTNTAYERMTAREDMWPEANSIMLEGLEDEKKHKDWLDNTLSDHKNS